MRAFCLCACFVYCLWHSECRYSRGSFRHLGSHFAAKCDGRKWGRGGEGETQMSGMFILNKRVSDSLKWSTGCKNSKTSAHFLGVEFHSHENRELLHKTAAWSSGWRVNYSWYSALTLSVKLTQSRPKLPLPLGLYNSEANLAAVNDAKMLYLEKWICLNIFAHCSRTFVVPQGKAIVFLAAAYEP